MVLTAARHGSKDAGSPENFASAGCTVGVAGAGNGTARRSLSPRPLNRSRGKRRGANTAAPPINKPGISAASTIAAPATTAPRVATVPVTPGPKAEPENQPPAGVKI